jgi:hypothetical protein
MQSQHEDYCRTLAHLPLHSLSRVTLQQCRLQLPTARPMLQLFYSRHTAHTGDIPATLRAALTNLERCPAWQQSGPTVYITLEASESLDSGFNNTDFHLVLGSLSAVASKHVQLCLDARVALLQESAVQTLGTALGERLLTLKLRACQLSNDFWAAVWAHLPGLQRLTLCDPLPGAGDGGVSQETLTSFCTHAARPLQLKLG